LLQWAANTSDNDFEVELLDKSTAGKIGLKSPCIIVNASTFKSLGMTFVVKSLQLQYAMIRRFKKEPVSTYRPVNIPGSRGIVRKRKWVKS
jgi:hypothetical protein